MASPAEAVPVREGLVEHIRPGGKRHGQMKITFEALPALERHGRPLGSTSVLRLVNVETDVDHQVHHIHEAYYQKINAERLQMRDVSDGVRLLVEYAPVGFDECSIICCGIAWSGRDFSINY